ncbi:MAG: SMC-Scp complex subunit ScpB [Chloroflexi bacterium]|nr:MAG: SMC-Scp complex subunit ScpB [Chloroflexota bacterium]MBL1193517.1 SMC-Scp complex subunit ScpB [Chloroflexota bacterium]NOH10808.1 SMC-Scp complex subunit ScpB [Chloroflexota bacterium]
MAADTTNENGSEPIKTEELSLEAQVEALLFVAPGAVTPKQLAEALEITPRRVEITLEKLEESYAQRGIRLQHHRGQIKLTTAPESAGQVERFLSLEATSRLSRAALETLAMIAYQEPVTRPQIDEVRGVNSDGVIRTLLSKGLIDEAGRAEGPGRPVLYTTTPDFLQHFGLTSLDELPPLAIPEPETSEEAEDTQMQLLKD